MDFLLTFFINIFDFIILNQYFCCFDKGKRKELFFSITLLFTSAFLLSIISTTEYLVWNLICSVLMIYLYGTNYQLSKIHYLVLPAFYLGIRFATEPAGILLLDVFNNLTPYMPEPVRFFLSSMVCECIRLFIVIMIKGYWKSRLIELPLIVFFFLCAIPVWGIISCCILIYTVWLYEMPGERLLCAEIIFIVVFTNIMAFVVLQKIRKVFYDIHKNEMLVQEAKLKEEYYHVLDQSSRQIRKIRHDLKNRLVGIYGIEGNEELVRSKLKEIVGELEDSSRNLYTANYALNSILNIKYKEADKEKINIKSDILVPKYMGIDYGDMGVLFGNLLDNAIEACKSIKEKEKWIEVVVNYEEHMLILRIRNSKNPLEGKKRKKEGLNHGIGLNSVKQIVEKYNGTVELVDLGEIFEFSAILYGIQGDKNRMPEKIEKRRQQFGEDRGRKRKKI